MSVSVRVLKHEVDEDTGEEACVLEFRRSGLVDLRAWLTCLRQTMMAAVPTMRLTIVNARSGASDLYQPIPMSVVASRMGSVPVRVVPLDDDGRMYFKEPVDLRCLFSNRFAGFDDSCECSAPPVFCEKCGVGAKAALKTEVQVEAEMLPPQQQQLMPVLFSGCGCALEPGFCDQCVAILKQGPLGASGLCRCVRSKGFCERCSIQFQARVVASPAAGPGTPVMSDMLQCVSRRTDFAAIIQSGVPITKVCAGQVLELTAFATIGTGKQHQCWSPVVAPAFKQEFSVVVKEPVCVKQEDFLAYEKACAEMVARFPGLFVVSAIGGLVVLKDACTPYDSEEVLSMEVKTRERFGLRVPLFTLEEESDVFTFQFETTSALSARDVAMNACSELIDDFNRQLAALARM